jgi:competence protein ComEC
MVVERQRLASQGALALTRRGDGFAVQPVKARGADRPWSPAKAGAGDFDGSLAPKTAVPRNRDATPAEADLQAED